MRIKDIAAGSTYVSHRGYRHKILTLQGFDKGASGPLSEGKKLLALIQEGHVRHDSAERFEVTAEQLLSELDMDALLGKKLRELGSSLDGSGTHLGLCSPRDLFGAPEQYEKMIADDVAASEARIAAFRTERQQFEDSLGRVGAILGIPVEAKLSRSDGKRTVVVTADQWDAMLVRLELLSAPLAAGAL